MRRRLAILTAIVMVTGACATHRLQVAKTHYQRGVELAGKMDRVAAAAEFQRSREEAAVLTQRGGGDSQAWLIKGHSEVELGQFEEARRSFAAARTHGGAAIEEEWESTAQLLGLAAVYEEMDMSEESASLYETAMGQAKKLSGGIFEAAASRWVDATLGLASDSADSKARGKILETIEKKVRAMAAESPASATLHYLLSQIEIHLEHYDEGWRQAVMARELGLPDQEFLRDNDASLLFCYQKLIEQGRSDYERRQAAWAERWGWESPSQPPWKQE